jgi:hypothetical protein
MMMMKKKSLILVLALGACITTAQAAWKVVTPLEANNGKWALYVDDEGIQKNGQRVRLWTLYDLPSGQLSVKEKDIRSIRDQIELDCERATYTSMGSSYSDGTMGAGQVILTLGASPEEDIVPNSAFATIAKRTCPAR